jgi:Ca2+-transporting ATPase
MPVPGPGARGLTSVEAAARLARDGPNELPSAKPRSPWAIAWEVVREPMFLLLIGAGVVYVALGDIEEALALLFSVLVMIAITFYQERRSERALEALRELASPRAQVLRDGEWRVVAGRDVVAGDLLRVKEGDRVPADARLEAATHLTADESLLTGESVPVRKRPGDAAAPLSRPGGDDLPFIYSGTLLTAGHGLARVIATGRDTAFGHIGKALQGIESEPSGIQRETRRAVVIFALLGLVMCVAVVVLYRIARGDWLNGLLAGITLAMASLPEEFPVVLTVFLALGAWRISRHGVLTRRAPAIETLGAAQVLCVDKTGTLTSNRMEVQRLFAEGRERDPRALDAAGIALLETGVLASEREPFDPMEKAYARLAQEASPDLSTKLAAWGRVRSYPLSPAQLSVAHVYDPGQGADWIVAAKGAPEAIADLCALPANERAAVQAVVERMAQDGLRVLAVARGTLPREPNGEQGPATQQDLGLRFSGLTGLADPLRPAVPAAIAQCYRAGIRTVMITGDHATTAQAIARQAGIANPASLATGSALDAMTPAQLRECVTRIDVFARVMPEHKLRLVEAFKASGRIVAMTGDGVNDAPALKAAHIGVAMGGRGSDVAREAAALVLLEDDFASLVTAVALGRRIYDNIRKAMRYIVAAHVPIAGMSLLPLAMGWPLLFYPVHIVFLELVIDPACSIAFEAEAAERDVMQRPPRPATAHLFDRRMLVTAMLQGAAVLAGTAALYGLLLYTQTPETTSRAMAFAAVVLANFALILGNRSEQPGFRDMFRPNRALWWVIAGAALALGLALYVEPLRAIFRFTPLDASQLALCALPGLGALGAMTLVKLARRRSATDPR